jgi:predicted metal-dependent phosphoesterase TrpH
MKIDAHCHTDCSDGNISIEERIGVIRKCGYDAATITDHDYTSTEQVRRAKAAAGDMPFIPGIELTLSHKGKIVHMLGYYVDPENLTLQQQIARVQNLDQAYTSMLIELFRPEGIRFGLADLVSPSIHTYYSLRFIKRISLELYSYDRKATTTAFLKALKRVGMQYADFSPWPVRKGIELIHGAGGFAVLAHPGGKNEAQMRMLGYLLHDESHIRQYADWGLDGIEVFSPAHTESETLLYDAAAHRFNLLKTAGSDCHGDDAFTGPMQMGIFTDIPHDLYESMLNYHQVQKCIV